MLDKKATPGTCRTCSGAIWDAQYCGFKVEADPTPINITEEIQCFLKKRYTYGISRWHPSFYLEWRTTSNIEQQYEYVLAEHQCHSPQSAREHPHYWGQPQPTQPNY